MADRGGGGGGNQQNQYITELRRENAVLQRKLHQCEQERDKAQAAEHNMNYRFEKEHHSVEEMTAKLKVAETQLSLARREIKVLQKHNATTTTQNKQQHLSTGAGKSHKNNNGSGSGGSENMKLIGNKSVDAEVRLQCALEEIHELRKVNRQFEEDLMLAKKSDGRASTSKLSADGEERLLLSPEEGGEKENLHSHHNSAFSSSSSAATTSWLKEELRKMEVQRAEFIAVIRKQNKLIDVLKRQKLHLEAAKLLDLAEADFVAALDSTGM